MTKLDIIENKEPEKIDFKQVETSNEERTATCWQKWKRYPKHVGFIIGNELCERFSYHGMKAVLLLYLRNFIGWSDNTSTAVYHAFLAFAYFMPLVGAIVADQYWGKYKTIIIFSIIYVLGHATKTVAAIPYIPSDIAHAVLAMLGLFLIGVGTGGIKPCVSSFGGDQFTPDQVEEQKQFFSLFYIAINVGALFSTFFTPMFRADVDCYPGETGPKFEECYALAFGVPGILMLTATVLFVMGTKWYTRYPPEGSLIPKVAKCIKSAVSNRWNTPKEKREKEHWLDYSSENSKLIRNTKYLLRIILLFTPIPFFNALFDQKGSRWIIQLLGMDLYLGSVLILPDQVNLINPFLIVVLVPFFTFVLYPLINKIVRVTPLRKMTFGFFLTAVTYVICALVQLEQDKYITAVPDEHQHGLRFINTEICPITVKIENGADDVILEMQPQNASSIQFIDLSNPVTVGYTSCNGNQNSLSLNDSAFMPEKVTEVVFSPSDILMFDMEIDKTENCKAKISSINTLQKDIKLSIKDEEFIMGAGSQTGIPVQIDGRGRAMITAEDPSNGDSFQFEMEVGCSGIYTVVIDESSSALNAWLINDIKENVVSVGWILPQYFLITCAEVLISVTGLEFSYSQAPPSMKAVITACWLLTVAIGNIIVLIVAEAAFFESQANEFFLFAGLVVAAGVAFAFLSVRYVYVDEREFEEEILQEQEKARKRAELYRRKKLAKESGVAINEMQMQENEDYEKPIKM